MSVKNYVEAINLTTQLNNAYGTLNYDNVLKMVKSKGYKVFRDSKGNHKLEDKPLEWGDVDKILGSGGIQWS